MALTHGKGIEITGLDEFRGRLERLMKFDPTFEKRVQKVIDQALVEVRRGVVKDAKEAMKEDPRNAARAVRRIVYRQILGGQVNILKKRRAGKLIDEDKVKYSNANQHWRRRGNTTGRIMRYQGSDRGFILRFANAGTMDRATVNIDNHPFYRKDVDERPAHRHYVNNHTLGYKRRNKSTNFFSKAEGHMRAELPSLAERVQELIVEEFNR